jgi:putative aldouronate transport system substrate-binding protein
MAATESPASPQRHLSRRTVLRTALAGVGLAASSALLAACGSEKTTGSPAPTPSAPATGATGAATAPASTGVARSSATAQSAQPAQNQTIEGRIPSGVDGVPDAYTKVPPPFPSVAGVPGKGGKVRFFTIAYSEPPTAHNDNRYWQELEKRLGVQWDVQLAPADSYAEKYAVLMASGDLPELIYLNPASVSVQLQPLKQGAFTDLTPYLTGDGLKAFPNLAQYPPFVWKNVAFQGKIYGVPKPVLRANGVPFYRADWAKKLGIAPPKNRDEVYAMLLAFAKNDPDGNGRPDTWGLAALPTAFWAPLFKVPNGWRKNPDGTLTHQIETDEYRRAVDFARRLFADGAYHPDAPSMTGEQGRDAVKASKIGLFSDGYIRFWGTNSVERLIRGLSSPTAELAPLLPPDQSSDLGVLNNSSGYFGFTATPAKIGQDREKVTELLRILDHLAAPFGAEEWRFIRYGFEGVHHTVSADGSFALMDRGKADIGPFQTLAYPLISEYIFFYPGTDDARTALDVNKRMIAIGIDNPTWNLFSPTGVAKQSQLDQLIRDRWIEIVTGRQPLAAVDELARDWRSRGGDDIRKEYQEALKESGG